MSNGTDQVVTTDEEPKDQETAPSRQDLTVELTAEQYESLLDKIEELEARQNKPQTRPLTDVDDLAAEGRRRPQEPTRQVPPVEIDQMTNSQLAQFIVDQVNQQVNQYAAPLVQDIEEVKLLMEIQKAEQKFPDFWDYRDAIHQLGRTQPHLTIEQAYLIASGQQKASPKTETPSGERKKSVITGLPPRPSYSGEKPSGTVPSKAAGDVPSSSIKDAAAKAWDEVVGKDKSAV